jgi:hypothetical protein
MAVMIIVAMVVVTVPRFGIGMLVRFCHPASVTQLGGFCSIRVPRLGASRRDTSGSGARSRDQSRAHPA